MPATSLGREVQERGYAAMAVLALLAACALERPPGVVRVTYDCDQGHGFVARYERDGEVILELDDGNGCCQRFRRAPAPGTTMAPMSSD